MKKIIFCLLFFTFSYSQANMVSYETIENFHKARIDSISQEYSLEGRAKISYSLYPLNSTQNKAKEIIKLPGILLDAVSLSSVRSEVGLVEIVDALKDYKRKIVILKSNNVSDKEVEVIQKALSEELFVKNPKQTFSVKPWSPGSVGSNQGWYENFKGSFYKNILMSPMVYLGIIAFLVIAFLIFTVATSILDGFKHVGKSIYDSVEKTMASNGMDAGGPQSGYIDPKDLEAMETLSGDDSDGGSQTHEVIEEHNETFLDCVAILKLMVKVNQTKPNELRFKMWEFFPAVEDQLNLYVTFETDLSDMEMLEFTNLFNDIFKLESAGDRGELQSKTFKTPALLWSLRIALTHVFVKAFDEKREELFGVFLEKYEGQVSQIIDGSMSKHFKILKTLFPDRVMQKLKSQKDMDEETSNQVVKMLTINKDEALPTDLEIREFKEHLAKNDYFLGASVQSDSSEELEILSRLPDHVLFGGENLKLEKIRSLQKTLPNFSWLDSVDAKEHKPFILSLSPDEANHFIDHYKKYSEIKDALDSRTLSRMQELKIKSKNSDSVQTILGLRKKIKYFYKPVETEALREVKQAA